tara:strand:+ start:160 stop:351 length:192 start_codon:yes stop_codon:yes gene_type:complete
MKTTAETLFNKYASTLFLPSKAWDKAEKMCIEKNQDWNNGTTTYIFDDSSELCAKESVWRVSA